MRRWLVLMALGVAFATPAAAFLAKNSLVVRDLGENAFEVKYRGLSGAQDFWCAAGDYVIRHLELPATTRIYRTSSPPRRAGESMRFSLRPEGAAGTGLALLGDSRGVSAAHARQFCEVPYLINRD